MSRLYEQFIKPYSQDYESKNRELVLNYVVCGLIILTALQFINTAIGYIVLHQTYMAYRLLAIFASLFLLTGLFWMARKYNHQKLAAYFVLGLILLATLSMTATWGAINPDTILLFALNIVMAGILLGARYSLIMALINSSALAIFELLKENDLITPNLAWMKEPSSFRDIVAFGFLFAVIALVSWLFNHQMEQSLVRARQSEAALSKQNDWLEATVKERTAQLEAAQLEKIQQVYKFAEMGRISSALFHDMANHLTSVSLGIEGINDSQQSELMQRVQTDIKYIDEIVQRVRLQLRGQSSNERFEIGNEISKVARILSYKMVQNHIQFKLTVSPKTIYWQGSLVPFRQIINNLLSNAIDAYSSSNRQNKEIIVSVIADSTSIIITIVDWGIGIPSDCYDRIFEPFYSQKVDGTGIGLYLVKQIVEDDLGGSISVQSNRQTGTYFTVRLAKNGPKRRRTIN